MDVHASESQICRRSDQGEILEPRVRTRAARSRRPRGTTSGRSAPSIPCRASPLLAVRSGHDADLGGAERRLVELDCLAGVLHGGAGRDGVASLAGTVQGERSVAALPRRATARPARGACRAARSGRKTHCRGGRAGRSLTLARTGVPNRQPAREYPRPRRGPRHDDRRGALAYAHDRHPALGGGRLGASELFRAIRAASIMVQVDRLVYPAMLVEIEAEPIVASRDEV